MQHGFALQLSSSCRRKKLLLIEWNCTLSRKRYVSVESTIGWGIQRCRLRTANDRMGRRTISFGRLRLLSPHPRNGSPKASVDQTCCSLPNETGPAILRALFPDRFVMAASPAPAHQFVKSMTAAVVLGRFGSVKTPFSGKSTVDWACPSGLPSVLPSKVCPPKVTPDVELKLGAVK